MSIAPFVEGTETYRRWLQQAIVYALSMTVAGATTGSIFALAGAGVSALWSDARVPLAAVLGAIALAYSLHELGVLQLRVPGRDWIVPAEWVRHGFYRSAVTWGTLVGFGVFTRVPFAALPVLAAWLFISGNVLYGLTAGAVYGATRAASIYASASSREVTDLVQINQLVMRLAGPGHLATGLFLAAFGAYLLAAPHLP